MNQEAPDNNLTCGELDANYNQDGLIGLADDDESTVIFKCNYPDGFCYYSGEDKDKFTYKYSGEPGTQVFSSSSGYSAIRTEIFESCNNWGLLFNSTYGGWSSERTGEIEYRLWNSFYFPDTAGDTLTLYTQYSFQDRSITFYDEIDGEEVYSETRTCYDPIEDGFWQSVADTLEPPEGCVFAGWYFDVTNNLTSPATHYEGLKSISECPPYWPGVNFSCYAVWEEAPNEYTVTFDTNGGSAVEPQTVTEGECATQPADPTREGYTFTGWFSDQACTEAFNFDTPITGNTTIYAGWEEITFTVTFDTNGGSAVDPQTVAEGECATKPADPTRDGYTFTGWFSDQACTEAFNFDTPITGNTTIYAGWEAVVPEPTQITVDMFTVDTSDVTYTGEAITKTITSNLVLGTDYTVEYANNVNAGTATITITGIGDYTGTLPYDFRITRSFTRLAGDDRFSTMEAVDDEGFEKSDVVVLTAGSNFPDALAASGLAGTYNCPIVLTSSNALSAEASEEISRLGASTVYIVGGENSVSAAAADTLKAMNLTVERIAGDDRYATALAVYNAGAGSWGSSGKGTAKTAIIAAGGSFPDTLSASSYAWWSTTPIFLSSSSGLDAATQSAIEQGGFNRILIVGGPNSVPTSVEDWARGVASTERLAGDNRYATSVEFATWAADEGMSFNNAGIATGSNFPDALAGGALCGVRGSVVLLADISATNGTAAVDLLGDHASEISRVYYLGGTNSVTTELTDLIEKTLS